MKITLNTLPFNPKFNVISSSKFARAWALMALGIWLTLSVAARADEKAPPFGRVSPAAVPFVVGGDLSFLARIEELGGRYSRNEEEGDVLEMMKARGANIVRLRLWVAPDGKNMNVNDLPYTLALAKRVKAAGLLFLLDIHYSDTWADPGHQTKPAAWKALDFEELTRKVADYSCDAVTQFRENGAMPDMVQIGNETPNGMLWPDGKTLEAGGWARYATLFRAGVAGVRRGAVGAKMPLIMIHIVNADTDLWKWFFSELDKKSGGIDFDVIGLSYYPGPDTRMAQLKSSLEELAQTYKKPIILAETNYPFAENDSAKRAQWEFPPTPAGQKAWLQSLTQTMSEVPNGLGRGLIWWAPEWVPIEGLGHYLGPKMLFNDKFEALPALDALSAQTPRSNQ